MRGTCLPSLYRAEPLQQTADTLTAIRAGIIGKVQKYYPASLAAENLHNLILKQLSIKETSVKKPQNFGQKKAGHKPGLEF